MQLGKDNLMCQYRPGAGKQLFRKRPGCPGGYQVEHQPPNAFAAKAAKPCTGLYEKNLGQRVKGTNYCPVSRIDETTSRILCPVLVSPVQERHQQTWLSLVDGHPDGQRAQAVRRELESTKFCSLLKRDG